MTMQENPTSETPETIEAPKPKSFFRQHTFAEKGPGRRETRDYLLSQAVVVTHLRGQAPLSTHELAKKLITERANRFPEQHAQNAVAAHRRADKIRLRVARRSMNLPTEITMPTPITSGEQDPTCFVYIIESTVDGRLYTGTTNDLVNRLALHNAGKGAKATRPGRPWKMVYQAKFDTRGDALREEARIKKLSRAEKLYIVREARIEKQVS